MAGDRAIISIRGVTKRFGTVTAVDAVSLDIAEGEFFALLGPSGCGKTTLLRMLAGFETPSEGEIYIEGRDMSHTEPNKRPVNMVFQSYAVFPHMSVERNIGYGLRVTGVPAEETRRRVAEALELVKLTGLERRMPSQLSGGQRQRVALARALVKRPKVLLLDEPLSALDAKLREAMRLELVRLQHTVGITFVIVTHDQDEALSMANRIAVMDGGRVRQVAPPAELYEFPNCRFVADFIGKMNLFQARVAGAADGRILLDVAGLDRVGVPFQGTARGDIAIAVRPEKIRLDRQPPADGRIGLKGRVTEVAYYGGESTVFLDNPTGVPVIVSITNEARRTTPAVSVGDELWLSWAPADTLVLAE
ncbi:MAG: ABC transporter ATP-binding protein [Rhodospirillaceae bacterium]|nr:ABC transporter ATP-binding protein [Rhodospirillaceae bacterium]